MKVKASIEKYTINKMNRKVKCAKIFIRHIKDKWLISLILKSLKSSFLKLKCTLENYANAALNEKLQAALQHMKWLSVS